MAAVSKISRALECATAEYSKGTSGGVWTRRAGRAGSANGSPHRHARLGRLSWSSVLVVCPDVWQLVEAASENYAAGPSATFGTDVRVDELAMPSGPL